MREKIKFLNEDSRGWRDNWLEFLCEWDDYSGTRNHNTYELHCVDVKYDWTLHTWYPKYQSLTLIVTAPQQGYIYQDTIQDNVLLACVMSA